MRLRLVPGVTNYDFFRWQWVTFGTSVAAVVLSLLAVLVMGLNFGVDFAGGTTIRTESTAPVDVAAYRAALDPLDLGDVVITEVFDPNFRPDQHVAQIRLELEEGAQAIAQERLDLIKGALRSIDPGISFPSVESVGPKVSGELIWSAVLSLGVAALALLVYIWLRFEWQFAVATVIALLHDVIVTVGVFALFQIRFDLTIVAGLLTILGYSINDKVVVFDRLRENLRKYKTMPLRELMNLTVNETLSRTLMTGVTVLLALIILMIWGGDVLRGFVFSIFFGTVIGTYSSIYMAKNIVLMIGLDRSEKAKKAGGGEFADIDA
jgi:preprotein translocase SecF subunit